ncbi:hypothetical protein HELRODRAFT_176190 [Helobdella robusta]|uniref:Uncharacterized protein n=1 Tax=Helobdella robusta TaxID=6412 RepID=T1FAA1_HELRO|nr:hypothetical protein HELRODRAFT_176190 [Helobdella robusta]ESO00321.1 hypothetical protein HELRODRAFT_176190 [Helobdella robusta]
MGTFRRSKCHKILFGPILHRHRGSSQDKRGGGLAVVHSNLLKATLIVDDMKYLGFENLSVKFNTYSSSFIISSIYRPPELSDVFCDVLSRGDYDVDDLTSAILTSTTNLFDKYAPFRRLSLRGSNRLRHQLLIGAINAIRICRRLGRQSKRFCSEIIKTEYKKTKEIAKTLIMQSKIDSIKEELHSKSNPRDL